MSENILGTLEEKNYPQGMFPSGTFVRTQPSGNGCSLHVPYLFHTHFLFLPTHILFIILINIPPFIPYNQNHDAGCPSLFPYTPINFFLKLMEWWTWAMDKLVEVMLLQ